MTFVQEACCLHAVERLHARPGLRFISTYPTFVIQLFVHSGYELPTLPQYIRNFDRIYLPTYLLPLRKMHVTAREIGCPPTYPT